MFYYLTFVSTQITPLLTNHFISTTLETVQRKKMEESTATKPHAICIPFPLQGHINPMLKLSLILHQKGFHITFVNTHFNHTRLINSNGPTSVQGSQHFYFTSIPDGLPQNDVDSTQNIVELGLSTSSNCLEPVMRLIEKLHCDESLPRVSCVVSDVLMSFGLDVAERIGVPGVLLRTAGACSFMCDKEIASLVHKGLLPLKDESLDSSVDWVPGMIPLRLTDFPNFSETTDPNNNMLNFLISETARSSKSSAIIINTFDELEHNVLAALSAICPPIYALGPFQLLFNQLVPENNRLKWMSSSLWKEDIQCLEWLDAKPKASVIYVNFGSIAMLTAEQLIEFALGLAESKKNILWVVRPDLVQGENAALSRDYWEELGDSGFVVAWCPQERVLNHPAIGGFLTHCGWNSLLESLYSGVPMLCWPFFADQHVNCRYMCDVWGVGMRIDKDVKRAEVGLLVRELLDGEKGKEMKKMAMQWKEKSAKAVAFDGSSYLGLEKLIHEVLSA